VPCSRTRKNLELSACRTRRFTAMFNSAASRFGRGGISRQCAAMSSVVDTRKVRTTFVIARHDEWRLGGNPYPFSLQPNPFLEPRRPWSSIRAFILPGGRQQARRGHFRSDQRADRLHLGKIHRTKRSRLCGLDRQKRPFCLSSGLAGPVTPYIWS